MVIAIRRAPGTEGSVHELSPQVSRLIVLAGAVLFWMLAGLTALALG